MQVAVTNCDGKKRENSQFGFSKQPGKYKYDVCQKQIRVCQAEKSRHPPIDGAYPDRQVTDQQTRHDNQIGKKEAIFKDFSQNTGQIKTGSTNIKKKQIRQSYHCTDCPRFKTMFFIFSGGKLISPKPSRAAKPIKFSEAGSIPKRLAAATFAETMSVDKISVL